MSNEPRKQCTFEKFSHWANDIVKPAYQGVNGGVLKPYHTKYLNYFSNNYYNWLNGTWNSYSTAKCDTFRNMYNQSHNQIKKPAVFKDEYQKAIMEAKMRWSQKVGEECGCMEPAVDPLNTYNPNMEMQTSETVPPPLPPTPPPPQPLQTPPPPPPTPAPVTVNQTSSSGGSSGGGSGGGY